MPEKSFGRIEDERDAKKIVKEYYEEKYRDPNTPSDSPAAAREKCMVEILLGLRTHAIEPPRILDIGSGAQQLEKDLFIKFLNPDDKALIQSAEFVTTDVAWIDKERLKADPQENVRHVQGDASLLPFANNTFGMLVSSMAIDLAPKQALSEAARVLTPGGLFVFTLNVESWLRKISQPEGSTPELYDFIRYRLDGEKTLLSSASEIKKAFAEEQLIVAKISYQQGSLLERVPWWFVKGRKLAEGEVIPTPNKDLTFSEK